MSEHAPKAPEQFAASPEATENKHLLRAEKEPLSPEELSPQEVRTEVAEALQKAEQEAGTPDKASEQDPTRNSGPHQITRKHKQRAYKHTLRDIQKDMSPTSKVFSRIIHQPAVEKASEVVGSTIARPTSVLYGSVSAFIVMLGVYMLAQHNGFRLSGSEFIALFAAGWLAGLIVDMIRTILIRHR